MNTHRDPTLYADRAAAGQVLAARLLPDFGEDVVVLGLTHGGVPVAVEVAGLLAAPLDVVVVSRLAIPWRPEVGMGAVAEGGARVIVDQVVDAALVSPHDLEVTERSARIRVAERVQRLRGDRAPSMLGGRTVVVVDDGIVSGASAQVACQVARSRGAARVVVATPVAARDGLRAVSAVADDVVVLQVHDDLLGLGQRYLDFGPIDDDDVAALVPAITGEPIAFTPEAPNPARAIPVETQDLVLAVGSAGLEGLLSVPGDARDLVIIANDSSRERFSTRSSYLSRALTGAGFATLRVDLLTPEEETRGNRLFAITMLSDRLHEVSRSVRGSFERIAYLAAGVGAAAALEAAAHDGVDIQAVACLGGRPDLAPRLGAIRAQVLFLVGRQDSAVLGITNDALSRLTCPHKTVIVSRAGPRFREPGALAEVADQLCRWLLTEGIPDRALRPCSAGPDATRLEAQKA
jgi:putative phosphoribosyl transferase